jgi:serine/threonine protein kinase/tetratricopeptide (TPR) repeat protein
MAADADRHFLFGLLALQVGLIDQSQLVAAFHAWTRDKARPLADHLRALGHLNLEQRGLVEALAAQHLKKHGGDAERSLAAVGVGTSIRRSLAAIGDSQISSTLVGLVLGPDGDGDPERTAFYSVGAPTSDGQRFRILRPHARGGLGAVFVAMDEELHREVALKQILDDYADEPGSRARFLAEAEITGGLEHPGIVPVYGLGTDGDGRPYYAMRFIRGDSLKEAIGHFHAGTLPAGLAGPAGSRDLALRKLLRRFVDVCNTIDYAHSRGVLHRDIKPANVIVGKYGETLVVDWGLAKAVGRAEPGVESGERTLVPSPASGSAGTLAGSALGTPAYMSPEQAEGQLERLGPRSDVYSLGATLYCLLTGKPPFAGEAADVIRAVQRGDVRPPRQLDSSIDPALEAICRKAMAHRPEDRYASGRALGDDLDRWMADEPVSAWREPPTRRARRWARRNRIAVTAAAVALVAGMVGLSAVLAVQTKANAELTRSRAAVEARYDLAVEAIRTFHTGVSQDFLLKQDQFKDVRDRLLKSASDFYGKLGRLLGQESDRASRRALWQANREVAELTARVGRPEDALVAHRQVLAAREALRAEAPADPDLTVDLARSLDAVAQLLETTGQTREAEVTYRKAETLLVESAPLTAKAAAQAALADCRRRLGFLLGHTGRNDEALSVFGQARADQEALAHSPGATAESRRDLADTITGVADLLSRTGRTAAAEAGYREAVAIQQELADANPGVPEFRNSLGSGHHNLGMLLGEMGRSTAAEIEYRKAVAIQQELADANQGVIDFRKVLASTHHGLGWLLHRTGESSEAAAEYRRALAIYQKLADDNPGVIELHSRLALSHNNLAFLLSHTGEASEATAEYRKAQAILQKLADDNPALTDFRHRLGLTFNGFGGLLHQTGKAEEAEAEFRKALALYQKLVDDNPAVTEFRSFLAHSHNNLGNLLSQAGRSSEAEAEYGRALLQRQKLVDDNPAIPRFRSDLANSLLHLGFQLAQAGRTDEALGYYAREEAIRQKLTEAGSATPDDREALANCRINTANLLRRSGKLDEALAACEHARALRGPLVEAHPESPRYRAGLGETYLRLGQVRCDMGDLAGAADAWKRACAHFDGTGSLDPELTFLRACGHACLASLAGRPGSGASAAEGADRSETAMAVLRRAVAMGYRDANAYRTESALDPLRDRDDFRLLMMDLAMPADPFAAAR